jgi:hypothetical protein
MRKSKASEAHRVAQQIAAIKAVLKKHGYRICKRPKQAAWIITPLNPQQTTPPSARGSGRKLTPLLTQAVSKETQKSYLLTYQPAPISAWILHPPSQDTDYQTHKILIQKATTRSAS